MIVSLDDEQFPPPRRKLAGKAHNPAGSTRRRGRSVCRQGPIFPERAHLAAGLKSRDKLSSWQLDSLRGDSTAASPLAMGKEAHLRISRAQEVGEIVTQKLLLLLLLLLLYCWHSQARRTRID